jgi:hypothetical protein
MATAAVSPLKVTPNTPDFQRPEVAQFAVARRRGRDLMDGSDAIHAAGETYLPKWSNEDQEMYKIRSTLTEVYGAFPRCVSAARGLVGAKPPTIPDDAPEAMREHWLDIDGQGTHGEVFAMQQFEDGLIDGHRLHSRRLSRAQIRPSRPSSSIRVGGSARSG